MISRRAFLKYVPYTIYEYMNIVYYIVYADAGAEPPACAASGFFSVVELSFIPFIPFIPSKRIGGPATAWLTKKETLLNANEINMTNTKKIMDEVLPIEVPRIFAIRIFYVHILIFLLIFD